MDGTKAFPEVARAEAGAGRPPGDGDLRVRLRAATDAAHRRLDAGFAAHDLTRRAEYAAFLVAMHAVFAPLEARLDGTGAGFLPPDWPARRRADALRADLAGLGIGGVASARDVPPPPCAGDEAAGLLYVLEGSRLGGQVLLRQVQASPDPVVRAHARFLRHGEGQRLWSGLVAWLGTRPTSSHEAAIRGALHAFGLFEAAQAAGQAPPVAAVDSVSTGPAITA